jgi:hypothetical protein
VRDRGIAVRSLDVVHQSAIVPNNETMYRSPATVGTTTASAAHTARYTGADF